MLQPAFARTIWPLLAALILLPLGFAPPGRPAVAAVDTSAVAASQLAAVSESEPNNSTAQADNVGIAAGTWSQQVTAAIGRSDDIDYFSFALLQPASSVTITLDNLPGDYDLVLAADPNTGLEQGESGLEDILDIGGSISAIGGSISAIGGSISAIGGSISAIGGSISAISANAGTEAEQIDTYLWQPGTYYIAVGPANGAFSASSYNLTIQVTGSGLAKPAQAAPEVEMRVAPPTYNGADPITTLYIVNSARMNSLYPGQTSQTASVLSQLTSLAQGGLSQNGTTEYGYVFDLKDLVPTNGTAPTVASIYDEWLANQGNPLYANKVARMVDNLLKAASDPARSGKSCPPGQATCTPGMYYRGGLSGPNAGAPFPDVRYIVLVGGDSIIPFFRSPDLTTIANEADYAAYLKSLDAGGIINPNSPQGAALKYRMILSDNPYGAHRPLRFQGFPLFAPDRAVGRLVESPQDILSYLDRWSAFESYTIDMRSFGEGTPRAYVNGYDFLKDQATAVSLTLKTRLSAAPPNIGLPAALTGPINDTWTRTDLENSWFQGDLTATVGTSPTLGIFSNTAQNDPNYSHPNGLFSLNSHFDHWQILPAKDTAGNFPAQRIFDPTYYVDPFQSFPVPGGYFHGTLGYSVGCHSGYSVLDNGILFGSRDPRYELYRADFAQAFIRHAGNWIGNTGYGYGTADGIDYSERLSTYLTQELMRDVQGDLGRATVGYVGASIGTALAQAKQRYLRNSATLSAYDAKALSVMTLYGLPFINVLVDNPLAPPPEEPRVGPNPTPVPTESKAPAGLPINGAGRLERLITVRVDLKPANYVTLPRTGSKLLRLSEQDFSVTDSFVQAGFVTPTLRVFENSQVGLPNLPTFAYDISALNSAGSDRLEVQDVVFVSGEYAPPIPFNPQITQIVTETEDPIVNTGAEPDFAAGAGIWYPDKFFGFSSIGQGEQQRDQLTATAAQFKADTNGITGQLRGYTEMVFKVYYIDPSASGAGSGQADTTAPVIQSVAISQFSAANAAAGALAADGVTIVATVDNGVGSGNTPVDAVSGVYVVNGTTWTPVTFSKVGTAGNLERWRAFIPLSPGQVRVIISVTDQAGNVSYYTAKGTFSLAGSQVYLPLVRR